MPPATTMPTSSDLISDEARDAATIPEAQTLFTVSAEVVWGMPLPMPACLAGAWPTPAPRTLPMMT